MVNFWYFMYEKKPKPAPQETIDSYFAKQGKLYHEEQINEGA